MFPLQIRLAMVVIETEIVIINRRESVVAILVLNWMPKEVQETEAEVVEVVVVMVEVDQCNSNK